MQTNNARAIAGANGQASTAPPLPIGTTARPLSIADIEGLRARREELSSQLVSAAGRRRNLAGELKTATGTDRVGLEQRIRVLDDRIAQIESDIASTGRELTSAPAGLLAVADRASSPRAFGIFSPDQTLALSIIFTVLVLFPLAMSYARTMWKRAKQPITVPIIQGEAAQRFDRLEHSIEAVAIEVERISEGQRFVTKLLSASGQQVALPQGQKETVPAKLSE